MQLITPPGNTAFVYLNKAQAPMEEGKEAQFSITLLFDKGDKKLKKLEDAIIEVAKAKWGDKAVTMLKKGQLRSPLRDGDEDRPDYDDFRGKVFITARSTEK